MKKTTFFILLIITIFSLSACNKKQAANTPDTGGGPGFRRPDFGQPERQADIRGLVKSVTGNEVVVIKLERPERAARGNEIEEDGEDGERTRTLNPGAAFGGGGRMPGMHGGKRPGVDEDSRAAMLERMKEMSSGEETVIIPVGIRMLKPDTDSEKMPSEILEATLTDVKADTMISVWLDEKVTNRKIAEFVLIMR